MRDLRWVGERQAEGRVEESGRPKVGGRETGIKIGWRERPDMRERERETDGQKGGRERDGLKKG